MCAVGWLVGVIGVYSSLPVLAIDVDLGRLQQSLEQLSSQIKVRINAVEQLKYAIEQLQDIRKLSAYRRVKEFSRYTEDMLLDLVFSFHKDLIEAWKARNFDEFDEASKAEWKQFNKGLDLTMEAIKNLFTEEQRARLTARTAEMGNRDSSVLAQSLKTWETFANSYLLAVHALFDITIVSLLQKKELAPLLDELKEIGASEEDTAALTDFHTAMYWKWVDMHPYL